MELLEILLLALAYCVITDLIIFVVVIGAAILDGSSSK